MYKRASALAVILAAVLASTLQVAITQQNSTAIAPATSSEAKPFLTVEKPMLGFKISYPSDWNVTDSDFVISFKAPSNTAVVTLSIRNLSSYSKANLTLEQYSLNQINTIKSIETKRFGNFFKLIESKPYLLSGQPSHEILFLTGTNTDTSHDYTKTLLAWSVVEGKIYQIRYSVKESEYPNYIQTVFYIIDSFRLL
jgi:hypothetical protein